MLRVVLLLGGEHEEKENAHVVEGCRLQAVTAASCAACLLLSQWSVTHPVLVLRGQA